MVNINMIVNALVLAAVGMMVTAGVVIGVTQLYNVETKCHNASYAYNASNPDSCYEIVSGVEVAPSIQTATKNLSRNTQFLTGKFGDQLGTVGTMFGVSLILGAIGMIGIGIAMGARKMK